MNTTTFPNGLNAMEHLVGPFSDCLNVESAQRIIAFQVAPEVQEYVDRLAERCNEGLLSASEREEYEAIVRAANFIGVFKIKARKLLAKKRA